MSRPPNIKELEERIALAIDLSISYDGFNDVEGLKSLVDDMVLALKGELKAVNEEEFGKRLEEIKHYYAAVDEHGNPMDMRSFSVPEHVGPIYVDAGELRDGQKLVGAVAHSTISYEHALEEARKTLVAWKAKETSCKS